MWKNSNRTSKNSSWKKHSSVHRLIGDRCEIHSPLVCSCHYSKKTFPFWTPRFKHRISAAHKEKRRIYGANNVIKWEMNPAIQWLHSRNLDGKQAQLQSVIERRSVLRSPQKDGFDRRSRHSASPPRVSSIATWLIHGLPCDHVSSLFIQADNGGKSRGVDPSHHCRLTGAL